MWPFTKRKSETEVEIEVEKVVVVLSEEQTLTVAKMLDAGGACEAGQHHYAKAVLWQYLDALFTPEQLARKGRKFISTANASKYVITFHLEPEAKHVAPGGARHGGLAE